MEKVRIKAAQEIDVSERVTFTDGHRTIVGHVAKKGRTYATVVTDDERTYRLPYPLLTRLVGAPRRHVQTRSDTLRAQFQASDRVGFVVGGRPQAGVLSRLNPRYAHVVCDDGQEYRVPYTQLRALARSPDATPGTPRPDAALAAIAARARAWIAAHPLEGWSFQFDHASTRAGCCRYDLRVISLAEAYARSATDAEIAEVLLHEIAHALVGPVHGHDAVWQAQAQALGCSGRRCHDVQFSPPRYLVTCVQGCWVSTAQRRTRGARCRTCQGEVHYVTYTVARWEQATAGGVAITPPSGARP